MMRFLSCFYVVLFLALTGCDLNAVNSPYSSEQAKENILYSSFTLRPKHLDPARSYSSNEASFTGQIYEPPLQYHYLKRPYELEPSPTIALPVSSKYSTVGNDVAVKASSSYGRLR